MSQCWQEGDWRAYLDGELTAAEMECAREHLVQCAACTDLHREIAGRAAQVGAMLMELDAAPVIAPRAAAARSSWKWAAAGVALAAALAAAFVMAPKRISVVEAPALATAPEIAPTAVPAVTPVMVKRGSPVRARRRAPQMQYFLALDEEPIDTGTVMRVALESGIEADLIVDATGRPRAIRAVR